MVNLFRKGKMLSALLLAAVLFFTSCKKDKSEEQPVNTNQRLEKISLGDEFLGFAYNTDGTLRQVQVKDELTSGGAVVTYAITYDAQKKMTEIVNSDGEKLKPFYVNNLMSQVEIRDDANTLIGITNYTYTGTLLSSATVRTSLLGQMTDLMKFEFTYNAAGNISKTTFFNTNPITGVLIPSGHVDYEYDNKANPLAAVSEFLKLLWIAPSANNITREIHRDDNNVLEETVEYTYTYNNQNLPKSGTMKRTAPGSPVENEVIQVIYK